MSIWPDPTLLAGAGEQGRLEDAPAAHSPAAPSGNEAEMPGSNPEMPGLPALPVVGRAAIRGRRQWPLPKQADPEAPLLVVEGLTTHFRLGGQTVYAVDDVSFTLEDGEALGIAGESGCGKTTTALSLLRLLPSNAEVVAGSVRLFGIDLQTRSEKALQRYRWREISIIFQGAMNALNPVQRVGDQIAEPMIERLDLSKAAAAKRAGELLELVGIPRARAKAYPHELSGGMRQRAMIAMALACDPAIIIGDEPTTALDVMVQAQILELLEDLREKLGLSLVLITHDLSVLAETCDRVMIMYAGRVAEEGPVGRVYGSPRHPYTQMLLRAFPDVLSGRRDLGTIPGSPPDLRTPPPGCRFHPRCPAVMDVCRTEVPPEVRFDDRVRVACHLYPPGSDGTPRPLPAAVAAGEPT
jgi:oligopeptide/dipeptide ABC transporter ATP-binding protein